MNRSNNRSGIFLLEIMLAILLFSIAGALCLQMFAKSRQMSKDTADLTQAAAHVQNAAELMKYAAEPTVWDTENTFFPDCLLKEYPDAVVSSNNIQIYFDENWNYCQKESGVYRMEAAPSQTENENLLCFRFAVFKADSQDSIYSLDFKLHIPNSIPQRSIVE